MSAGVISSLLNQVSSLIIEEAKLLGGLDEEIRGIIYELEHMKAFLMFAESREEEDVQLQVWVSQVQDVAYDIQDVVDEFLLRFTDHSLGRGFYGRLQNIFTSIRSSPARHRIAQEIQAINLRLANVSDCHRRYKSEYVVIPNQASSSSASPNVNNSWHNYKGMALHVEDAMLVGVDHPKQHLISQLLDGSRFKVVSVLGMGGVGKTTLVKNVQEHRDVKRRFDIHAWVTVSQTFDMKDILRDMVQQLYEQMKKPVPRKVAAFSSSLTIDHLKQLIIEALICNKRYLIVFDDVWDPEFWNAVKPVLPDFGYRCRVMLTTRRSDVAHISNITVQCYVHLMQPLSSEDSWTLFCRKTFKDSCCPSHLENVAKGILRKCEGLPLAIVAVGGMLASENINKADVWKTVEHGLSGELEGVNGKLDAVRKILSLSYNELPYHLKTCLLYASVFPEDYEIEEERLIRCWISEGFVVEKTRMTAYEVARVYLDELIKRSLVQVALKPNYQTLRVYHMHDLVRETILLKSSRQNFATTDFGRQKSWPKKVRRLVIHNFNSDMKGSTSFPHLRSLVIFRSQIHLLKYVLSHLLYGGSGLMKILDLEGTQLDEIPKVVFGLVRLKTLSLKHTRVKVIPKSIGSLKNLEYLDLSFTNVRKLPKDIVKIKGLIHLIVFDRQQKGTSCLFSGFKGPKNIAELVCLEWLYDIRANELLITQMGELKQLRRFGITNLKNVHGKQLCNSLGKLHNLEQLYLEAQTDHEILDLEDMNTTFCSNLQNLQVLSLWGRLQELPQVISSLHALTAIELGWSRLGADPLEPLQHLSNLQSVLLNEAFVGESLCFKPGCLLKLEFLCLSKLPFLKRLTVEEGALPNLGTLDLASLPLLEEFPWGVGHLTKLQHLYLQDLSHGVDKMLAVVEYSENYKKISHIPKIWIKGRYNDEGELCTLQNYWNSRRGSCPAYYSSDEE